MVSFSTPSESLESQRDEVIDGLRLDSRSRFGKAVGGVVKFGMDGADLGIQVTAYAGGRVVNSAVGGVQKLYRGITNKSFSNN